MELLLICCSLIAIVCIICYTKYKTDITNNNSFRELHRHIGTLDEKIDENACDLDTLNEKIDEIVSYIREDKLF